MGEEREHVLSVLDLARRFVDLKKVGRQWRGLCPLHKEDTPSFYVDEAKQAFYCQGCGAGGGYRALAAGLLGEQGLSLPLPAPRPWPTRPRPQMTPWGAFAPNAEMAVRDLLATIPPWADRTAEAAAWAAGLQVVTFPVDRET